MSENLGFTQDTHSVVPLLVTDFPSVTIPITIASGNQVVKGQVLGRITDDDEYKGYDPDANDGSQNADLIATEDVDATDADVDTAAIAFGKVNEAALTGLDAAARVALRKQGIFVVKVL